MLKKKKQADHFDVRGDGLRRRPEGYGWTLCGTIVSLGSGPDHTRDTCALSGNKTHTSGSKREVNIATRAPGGGRRSLGGSEGAHTQVCRAPRRAGFAWDSHVVTNS